MPAASPTQTRCGAAIRAPDRKRQAGQPRAPSGSVTPHAASPSRSSASISAPDFFTDSVCIAPTFSRPPGAGKSHR